MIRSIDLLRYLPKFMQEVKKMQKIMESENPEFQIVEDEREKVLNNQFIKNCDLNSLERYEEIFGIKIKAETIEARKQNVLLKINDDIPYTYKWLVKTLNAIFGSSNYRIVTDFKNYKMDLEILLSYSEMVETLKRDLRKQIPANLILNYRLYTNLKLMLGAIIVQERSYMKIASGVGELKEKNEVNTNCYIGIAINVHDYVKI